MLTLLSFSRLLSLYLTVCVSCVSNFLFDESPPSANVLSSLVHYTVSSSTTIVYDCLLVIMVLAYIIESFLMTHTARGETHTMWNDLLFVCIFFCLQDAIYRSSLSINYLYEKKRCKREQSEGFIQLSEFG